MNGPSVDNMPLTLSDAEYPDFCCPQCKATLDREAEAFRCARCPRRYPIVLGIPDFRVFPDPYIDYQDDHRKAAYVVEQTEARGLTFEGMVRLYWSITPEVSADRAERFIQRVLVLGEKALDNLNEIQQLSVRRRPIRPGALLEIGCGTGAFLAAAADRFDHVVGIDIAFRWLVVARKRHEELGLKVPLVCCCAEYLPFAGNIFDLVVAENVLEHVKDQRATVRECRRVLRHQGALFLSTPNRYTLTPEPHVRVWGVGFLPRRWMSPYVQKVKGFPYRHLRLLSLFELVRLLRRASFRQLQVVLPFPPEKEIAGYGSAERLQVMVYGVARKLPALRESLYLIGPAFHALCYADKHRARRSRAPQGTGPHS